MLHFKEPMEKYLTHPGIGSSLLKQILTTPADFLAAKSKRSTETKATALGTAIHMAVLEPDEFAMHYALQPEDWGARNKGLGYQKWAEFKEQCALEDKWPMTWEDSELLADVLLASSRVTELGDLMGWGNTEVTAYSAHFKARTDLLSRTLCGTKESLWDVKTTSESLDDGNIAKIILSAGYHFQAAHHLQTISAAQVEKEPIKNFGWIFITTKTPAVHIRLVPCPDELLEWGKRDHDIAVRRYLDCLARDDWPGYSHVLENLEIPHWIRKANE